MFKGVNVNSQIKYGITPLHLTTNPEIIELIKKHKPSSQ